MQFRCRVSRSFRKYKKPAFLWIGATFAIVSLLQVSRLLWPSNLSNDNEPIDVVYTWVNGSDEKFVKNLYSYYGKDAFRKREFNSQRFDDKYELKFSLRSLERYAPWVRHVYIVTNGQIPYWLNLDCEKVTLVTHSDIFVEPANLPTFSSPAIEVHLHRIPGLSKRFLYFNDDMFLGSPLFIDDFYTESRGFIIYLAWPLPMCSSDCPWIYVADGQCDKACYNEECQFDGNDCDTKKNVNLGHESVMQHLQEDLYEIDYDVDIRKDSRKLLQFDESSRQIDSVVANLSIVKFNNDQEKHKPVNFSASHNILTETKNLNLSETNLEFNLPNVVAEHNMEVMKLDKIRRKKRFWRKRPHSKHRLKPLLENSNDTLLSKPKISTSTAEAYALSLQHSNRVFNSRYGYMPRYVPAHSAIMIDKEIMEKMQRNFSKEIGVTAGNRIRNSNDMQFSFTYYYYLIHERDTLDISQIFDIFDTDSSGTWSDREIRTLLTKLYDLPLSYMIVDHFEYILTNCSKDGVFPEVATPEYERYIDSKLPTISKELVRTCKTLKDILMEQFGQQIKYKHDSLKNTHAKYIAFKMLTSNVSEVVGHLDEIRRKPSKFVCLNDNLNYEKTEENELVRAVLYDFYLSLFPHPSKFELPSEFRNRFLYKQELDDWKKYHFQLKLVIYLFVCILLYLSVSSMCKKRNVCSLFNKLFY